MVGSGTAFLSGVSYYTHRLATALAEDADVSVILMRRLIPTRLYPGRVRVGDELASFRYPAEVPVFAGLRSLALGADEDRLLLLSLLPAPSAEEAERLIQRVQLEMDADEPPMGRLVALPVIAAPVFRRP